LLRHFITIRVSNDRRNWSRSASAPSAVFVDFWNFSLALRGIDADFRVDWQKIGPVLAQSSGQLIDAGAPVAYEGMTVYGSYDPGKPQDAKLRSWFSNTLDKMAGVSVVLQARQRKKGYPKCPACQAEVAVCAACSADMRGTEEKRRRHKNRD
jgi:hypothetical protein